MEPQRGEAELQLVWGTTTTAGVSGNDDDAAAAACLCPAAVQAAAAGATGGACSLLPRHALEQEVLHRADLQQQLMQQQGGDRRRERKMRNRESAARSRLRRCAYVSELEKEVSLLRAEIHDLRKLCNQLKKEAAEAPVHQAANKNNKRPAAGQLQRTSSASF
ncbi:hypothetical protein HU200_011737 [Digitaria exilis]|uniref:BZIP domain-containing protein n=1 Tax=Digitaria exilis TaxID=1010633 RepID=A0A835FGJ1_9POAL|nr:hypothetical protein HU200_011737 [Digitaria exilis]CAB3483759.1 unnamed protein product [Digitaria exilis]